MHNLIAYSSNYSETTGRLWFYSKDKATDFIDNVASTNNFKSFKYNPRLLENTVVQPTPNQADGILKNATVAVALEYLSNFWRSLEIPLIIYKIELKFKWTKYCVLPANGNDNTNDNCNEVISFLLSKTQI